jgi:hypothetical protein
VSSGTFVSLAGVLTRLEAMADELPSEPSLEALAAYVSGRAPLAETLSSFDPQELKTGERRSLATRLARVLERDQALVTALFARRENVGAQLKAVHDARVAARGYGGRSEGTRVLRKTA